MNNFYRTILALVAVFVLAFSTFPPNSDAKSTISTDNVDKDKVKSEAEFIADHTIDVSKKTKEKLLSKAEKAIEDGDIKYHKSNEKVFDNASSVRAIKYDDGTVTYSVSYLYVATEKVDRVSSFNVSFDSDMNIEEYYEVDMKKISSTQNEMNYWVNGVKDEDKSGVFETKQTSEDKGSTSNMMSAQKSWTGCVSDCLGDKNISQWAITGLAILCGVSCTAGVPATAGTACYACVNSAGIIGVNAFFDCMEKCK
ncbi:MULTISPECIES: hypothetical protein [Bacillus]|uniref:hypothetical protein n=1 Tax=Bacillus TaxID=1386 RepID=UPI0003873FFE|nr:MULTISPECIES: hypothetical protein [Bacillus]MBU8886006.1 hypothetical protein [Bacillus sp. FJAT-27001]CDG29999.1 conserved exported protein of unknown function [Bacillus velezensis UCMB5033]